MSQFGLDKTTERQREFSRCLTRLSSASNEEWGTFSKEVLRERRILNKYPAPTIINESFHFKKDDIDKTAAIHVPADFRHLVPIKSLGDGSCLFHSVSVAFSGDMRYSAEFRVRVVIELLENFTRYEQLDRCFRNADDFDRKTVRQTTKSNIFCGMIHILALSNCLNIRIMSVYPNVNSQIRDVFHRLIVPCCQTGETHPELHLLWTRTELWGDNPYWNPNHFVPLFNPDMVGVGLPDVDRSSWEHKLAQNICQLPSFNSVIDLTAADIELCKKCNSPVDSSASENHRCTKCLYCEEFFSDEYMKMHVDENHSNNYQTVDEVQYKKMGSSKHGMRYFKCTFSSCNGTLRVKGNHLSLLRMHTCVKKTDCLSVESKKILEDNFGKRNFEIFGQGDASKCFLYGNSWPDVNFKILGWGHTHLRRSNKVLTWDYRKCSTKLCKAILNFISFRVENVNVIVATGSHFSNCTSNYFDLTADTSFCELQADVLDTAERSQRIEDAESMYVDVMECVDDTVNTDPCVQKMNSTHNHHLSDSDNIDFYDSGDDLNTCSSYSLLLDNCGAVSNKASKSDGSSEPTKHPVPFSDTIVDINSQKYSASDFQDIESTDSKSHDFQDPVEQKTHTHLETSASKYDNCTTQTCVNMKNNIVNQQDVGNDSLLPPRNWGKIEGKKQNGYRRKCKGSYVCEKCGKKSRRRSRCFNCGSKYFRRMECTAVLLVHTKNEEINYSELGFHHCDFFVNDEVISKTEMLSLPNDGQKLFDHLNDGRCWGRYITLKSNPGSNKYRRYCKGMFLCENDSCPFKLKADKRNTFHFSTVHSPHICDICGLSARQIECNAFLDIETDKQEETVRLIYGGEHTCIANPRLNISHKEDVKRLFEWFPGLGGTAAIKVVMNNILKQFVADPTDDKLQNLHNAAEGLVDNELVRKLKADVRKGIELVKNSFQAVDIFAERTKKFDNYLVYETHSNKYVFTTSARKLELAMELNECKGTSDGFVHVDFQASRVKNMTCFGMNIYYPLLKQTVNLCKSYSFCEDTDSVLFALKTMRRAVEEASKGEASFEPEGWMADEAGAIHQGLQQIYGEKVNEKVVTCQAHYMSSVKRNTKKCIGDEKAKNNYQQMAKGLKSAVTPREYKRILKNMKAFVTETQQRSHLIHWLSWWHDRRSHWADAFRKKDSPTTNLSEVFHAKEWHRRSMGVSLIDAIYDDACDSVLLNSKIDGFLKGSYGGGTGPAIHQVTLQKDLKQQYRALKYGQSIESQSSCDNVDIEKAFHDLPIDVDSTHREDTKVRRTPVKRKIAAITQVLSESDDSETGNRETKVVSEKKCRRRFQQSSLFKITLKKVKDECTNYKIYEDTDISDKVCRGFRIEHRYDFDRSYTAIFKQGPSCTCMFYQLKKNSKRVEICKHIIMALFCLGVEPDDTLLNQATYTDEEMSRILTSKFSEARLNERVRRQLQLKSAEDIPDNIPFLEKYLHLRGRRPQCVTCHRYLENGLVIAMNGRYRSGTFSRKHKFRYCLDLACFSKAPDKSTIATFSGRIRGDLASSGEIDFALDKGLEIV